MKKRLCLLVILFIVLNIFCPFSVLANEQPAVCGGPSKEMSQYFEFQNEMRSALFNSDANEKRLTVGDSNWWLFGENVLTLPTAMDLVSLSVAWRALSLISTATTSLIVALMAWGSTALSIFDSLWILVQDRPIVRDYREMLSIETKLFDAAFFRSQQLNLAREIEWTLLDDLNDIIKKYRKLGLLWEWQDIRNASISDILIELISMNSVMRNFISYKNVWVLKNYNWCIWNLQYWDECVASLAVLRFNEDAIEKMKEDYSKIRDFWGFWGCNQYKNNFSSTLSKWRKNGATSVEVALQDFKDAHVRLRNTTLWWIWKGRRKLVTDPCNMSEYEMAQLRAYRWSDWECWEWVSASSTFYAAKDSIAYFQKNKEVMRNQFKGVVTNIKNAFKTGKAKDTDLPEEIDKQPTTAEKSKKWKDIFWTWVSYNPEFSSKMYTDFTEIYESLMDDFYMSQYNASASDLWVELGKIQWLVNQVDEVSNAIWEDNGEWLKKKLRDIVNYQCSE